MLLDAVPPVVLALPLPPDAVFAIVPAPPEAEALPPVPVTVLTFEVLDVLAPVAAFVPPPGTGSSDEIAPDPPADECPPELEFSLPPVVVASPVESAVLAVFPVEFESFCFELALPPEVLPNALPLSDWDAQPGKTPTEDAKSQLAVTILGKALAHMRRSIACTPQARSWNLETA